MLQSRFPAELVGLVALVLSGIACSPVENGRTPSDPPPGDSTTELTILVPRESTIVAGIATVTVAVSGETPQEVVLRVDGTMVAVSSAPFTFEWNTIDVAEGAHVLLAEADVNGHVVRSAPRTIIVDQTDSTRPVVVSRTPTPGSFHVSVHDAFSATFSEPMQPESVNSDSVIVSTLGGQRLASDIELSGDGLDLTVQLQSPPNVPSQLVVTLTEDLADLAGNALIPPDDAWTFEIPDWLAIGPALPGDREAVRQQPSLALDSAGHPIVAFMEQLEGSQEIRVQRWNGDAWQTMGGVISGPNPAMHPSLALNSSGQPTIAWSEYDGTIAANVYVSRWDGSGWQAIGRPLSARFGSTDAQEPVLSVDAVGNPVVAWRESDGVAESVHVRRWDGSAWREIGGSLSGVSGSTNAFSPSLDLLSDGSPVVAWHEWDSGSYVFVQQWDGSAWTPIGSRLGPGGEASVRADSEGRVVVSWRPSDSYEIFVQQWTGSTWLALGDPPTSSYGARAFEHSLALDESGMPVIVWRQAVGGGFHDAHVWRWDSESWRSVGGGISALSGLSSRAMGPSIALDAFGNPTVAWSESERIWVRKFNR